MQVVMKVHIAVDMGESCICISRNLNTEYRETRGANIMPLHKLYTKSIEFTVKTD